MPAILLDRYVPRRVHVLLQRILLGTTMLAAVAALALAALASFQSDTPLIRELFSSASLPTALFFIFLGPLASLYLFSFFYNSLYFRGIESIVRESSVIDGGITYEVARVFALDENDLTYSFLTSLYGQNIMLRCGVLGDDLVAFLSGERETLSTESIKIPDDSFLTLLDVANHLFLKDAAFSEFLFKHGVSEEIFKGAVEWIMRMHYTVKYQSRWWSRDNLGKVSGIGREFSFGVAYELRKYVRDIRTSAVFSALSYDTAYADDIIAKIESILAKTHEANVIVVGEPGVGKMDVLVALGKKMKDGKSVESIVGKRLVVFDGEAFTATHNTKQEFEFDFLRLLSQAERAGNIVVVLENLGKFLANIEALGVDAGDLLDRFLGSPNLQVVATSDPQNYHHNLESKPQLLQRFEPVYMENPDLSSTVRVLEDVSLVHEVTHKVTFTYPAIRAIAESADRYVTEGVMPDKAVDLLVELAPVAAQKGTTLVRREFVEEFVSEKTGIPTGPIKEEERDTLMRLEEVLHQRVIGQNAAIDALASAMRRSRAGIQDKDRPMGSFLFLGSTGVGKTETAKALTAVFFGDEEKMLRLDMSEYSGMDAITKLMGVEGQSGILTGMLHEHPYGVLLLDEFEKASDDVHNLFLQILDEGVFTDARGTKVNARNTIIIATSNAGSNMIWDMAKEGKNPSDERDAIIAAIIQGSIFRPELINRFDGVIIFEPLSLEHQEKIARLMLGDLQERIKEKGYELKIDEVLVNLLTTKGYDPEFGARPMRRVLQDVIEEKIAQKIISGGLKPGDQIWFTDEDFTEPAPDA